MKISWQGNFAVGYPDLTLPNTSRRSVEPCESHMNRARMLYHCTLCPITFYFNGLVKGNELSIILCQNNILVYTNTYKDSSLGYYSIVVWVWSNVFMAKMYTHRKQAGSNLCPPDVGNHTFLGPKLCTNRKQIGPTFCHKIIHFKFWYFLEKNCHYF